MFAFVTAPQLKVAEPPAVILVGEPVNDAFTGVPLHPVCGGGGAGTVEVRVGVAGAGCPGVGVRVRVAVGTVTVTTSETSTRFSFEPHSAMSV